jgi:cell division protein FtsW
MKAVRGELWILTIALLLTAGGLVMVYSASSIIAQERFNDGYFFLRKQAVFAGIGLIVMILLAKIPYAAWRHLAYPSLLVSFLLLLLLCIPGFGATAGGATRWLRLGGFASSDGSGQAFPVLFLAAFLPGGGPDGGVPEGLHGAPPVFSRHGSPSAPPADFGTSVLLCAVFFLLFYLAGAAPPPGGALSLAVPARLYVLFSSLTAEADPWPF